MPRLGTLGSLAVYLYADDHAPPHFHVTGPDTSVLINIETLQIIRGKIRGKDYAEVVAWAAANQGALRQEWSRLNERD